MQKLTLGFSSCPNDTFIFDALINGRIDTGNYSFSPVIKDVESLNRRAVRRGLDITKISFFAYSKVWQSYKLLDAGGAAGFGCGPLIISNGKCTLSDIKTGTKKIAIPGKNTTANLLFSLAFPDAVNKKTMVFSEIEDAVIRGKADAGVIIHESRFTYRKKGLNKILDLGEFWKKLTGLPVPLGAIAVKRNIPAKTQKKINRLIRTSVRFAMKYPVASRNFVRQHAQEMENLVIRKHINLYVNDFTIGFRREGRKAIHTLFKLAYEKKFIEEMPEDYLINKSPS